ncbi:hypothetical protein FACS1894187_12660 [Synergistales bacterium]|nr:hypothetical protein FACS1894187_12660 [Synergistales bacterium]
MKGVSRLSTRRVHLKAEDKNSKELFQILDELQNKETQCVVEATIKYCNSLNPASKTADEIKAGHEALEMGKKLLNTNFYNADKSTLEELDAYFHFGLTGEKSFYEGLSKWKDLRKNFYDFINQKAKLHRQYTNQPQ